MYKYYYFTLVIHVLETLLLHTALILHTFSVSFYFAVLALPEYCAELTTRCIYLMRGNRRENKLAYTAGTKLKSRLLTIGSHETGMCPYCSEKP